MVKEELYKDAVGYISSITEKETEQVSALANVAAILKETLPYYFWVGFYLVKDEQLVLGPFQGPVACTRIKKGNGVCGEAWDLAETVVVDDVDLFPGHIRCSSESKSEIVVPIINDDDDVVAVIDVDSAELASFDDTDQEYLEQIAKMLVKFF